MSVILPDLVKIQVLSTGTGPFQLGAAAQGFRGIEALINGGEYAYSVQSGGNYEVGTGIYNSGSGVLTRVPTVSSNGNAAVAFGANVEVKFIARGEDLAPPGSLPIVQNPGQNTNVAMSQKAVTDALDGLTVSKATAAAMGVSGSDVDLGTFTGSTIPDDATAKSALQALETAIEQGLFIDLSKWPGVDMTGATDSAAGVQAAVTAAQTSGKALFLPASVAGQYVRLDSRITITSPVSIFGTSFMVGKALAGYVDGAQIGPASRFHLNHSDIGFYIDGSGGTFDGVFIRGIMTSRNQPAPVDEEAWTPNDHDYDFEMFGAGGLNLQNVMLLNPTRGINLAGGGNVGRLWADNLMGQPMVTGINVELAADVVRLNNVHWWPFWSDHLEVNRWTLNNSDHLWLKRCDTPLITNYFSIAARAIVRFSTNGFGSTTKAHFSCYDGDVSQYGVWFDDTCINAWARFDNGALNGANSTGDVSNTPALPVRYCAKMEGLSCFLMLNGAELSGGSGADIDIGEGNFCQISGDLWIQNYGENPPGNFDPCFYAGAGSTFVLPSYILNTSGPGGAAAGALIGGPGRFIGPRKGYVPGVTPQTGSFAGVSIVDAQFSDDGTIISGVVDILVSDATGASGYVDISLPTEIDIGFGFNASDATDGTLFSCRAIPGNPGTARILRPGGGNVGVTAHVINLTFTYVRATS